VSLLYLGDEPNERQWRRHPCDGYVMKALHVMTSAEDRGAFARGLRPTKALTAWNSGEWVFGDERRPRNGLQNAPSSIRRLSLYLVDESRPTLTDAEAV
jgi:hypothetical protein